MFVFSQGSMVRKIRDFLFKCDCHFSLEGWLLKYSQVQRSKNVYLGIIIVRMYLYSKK